MTHATKAATPTPLVALGLLAAAVVIVAAYLGLAYGLGLREPWAGFLLLLCFAYFGEFKMAALPAVLSGALFGIAIAAIPGWLTPALGFVNANLAMVAVILVTVYLLLLERAKAVVNQSAMVFLTIATIPHIASAARPGDMAVGAVLGAAFFGALVLIGGILAARGKRPAGSASSGP